MTLLSLVGGFLGSGLVGGVVVAVVNHFAGRKLEADRRRHENRSRFLTECRDEYVTLMRAADDIVYQPRREGAVAQAAKDLDEHRSRVMLVAPPDVWRYAVRMVDTATEANVDRGTPKVAPNSTTHDAVDQAIMDRYVAAKVGFVRAARRHIDPDAEDLKLSPTELETLQRS